MTDGKPVTASNVGRSSRRIRQGEETRVGARLTECR
jgi:methyl coenzyme M reductase subunit C-like uncharacterized protein (methanogenesis marker protein 7)